MKDLHVLWIGLAGGVGAVLRVYASAALEQRWGHLGAGIGGGHLGTLVVNLVGCFLVGALSHALTIPEGWPQEWRLILMGGLLGGLTTFGTLGGLLLEHLERGAWSGLGLHLVGHLVGGVAAVWLGRSVARVCLG